jgi:hypothetical protein
MVRRTQEMDVSRTILRRAVFPLVLAFLSLWGVSSAAPPSVLSRGLFEIQYASEDEEVAQRSLEILQTGLAEFTEHLLPGDTPIRVTICHTLEDFRRVAGEYGRASVGGIARSRQSMIIVKGPHLLPEARDYRGMLRHELIHVLLARNTEEANVPRWFNEGVAMVVSRELRWESGLRIARMYVRRRLIAYPELNLAFAPLGNEETFDDAYAQALSMTRYLVDHLGEDRFWQIVRSLKTQSFEDALRAYAGMTPADLYDAWHASLWQVALISSLVSGFSAFQLMAILVVVAYLRKRRRGQQILQQWEEEENEPEVFSWEALEEGPCPWEEEEEKRG